MTAEPAPFSSFPKFLLGIEARKAHAAKLNALKTAAAPQPPPQQGLE